MSSVPFSFVQKIADIPMLDAITAHVKFIKGDNILWKIFADMPNYIYA